MKRLITLMALLFCISVINSQQELNQYKYVVVPLQYDFLKGKNVYRLNTLTKYLFNQNGYKAYFNEQDFPEDLFKDRCLAMYADVKEVSAGFRQKGLEIYIKDCYGKLIMKSSVGDSGLNNHKDAYHEALREAFETFKFISYKYNPKEIKDPQVKPLEMSKVEEKKETLKEKESNAIIKNEEDLSKNSTLEKVSNDMLIAEAFGTLNYNLKNSEGKLVYTLLFSGKENLYIVKGRNAVVYRLNNNWVMAENSGDVVKINAIDIQF